MKKHKKRSNFAKKPKASNNQMYNMMKFFYPTVSAIVAVYFKENISGILSKNYEDISKDAWAYCLPKIIEYAKSIPDSQFKKYNLKILELAISKEIDMLDQIKKLQESNQLPKTLTWYQTFLKSSAMGMQLAEGVAKSFGSGYVVNTINKYCVNTTQQILLLPAWVVTAFMINRMTDSFRYYIPLPSDVLKHALMESLKNSQPNLDISREQENEIRELQTLIETKLGEGFKEVLDSRGSSNQINAKANLKKIQDRIEHLTQSLTELPRPHATF